MNFHEYAATRGKRRSEGEHKNGSHLAVRLTGNESRRDYDKRRD